MIKKIFHFLTGNGSQTRRASEAGDHAAVKEASSDQQPLGRRHRPRRQRGGYARTPRRERGCRVCSG